MHTISLLEQTVGIPFTHDNTVEVLKNGDEIFPAMLTAIENATQSVDFLTFVYWEGYIADKFAEALSEKPRREYKFVYYWMHSVHCQ